MKTKNKNKANLKLKYFNSIFKIIVYIYKSKNVKVTINQKNLHDLPNQLS